MKAPVPQPSRALITGASLRIGGCAALAALLLLATGSDGLQNAIANGDTRTLSFVHLHTKERLTVTFKRDGRFDDDGLSKLNHFLRDWRNGDQIKMDPRLFDIVWQVYQEAGASQPIQIISAYRSPATNSMLRRRSRGVAKQSQHTLGKAIDFNIPGVALDRVRNAGLRLQRGGVGFYPSSGSPFVHLDVGNVRHWPRLSPDALARVFPDGRTVHLPSNGRPMPGYALALADIARRNAAPSDTTSSAVRTAALERRPPPPAQRTWLTRIFGAGADGARDQAEPAARPGAPQDIAPAQVASVAPAQVASVAPAQLAAVAPAQIASAVPMPRHRPSLQAAPATSTQATLTQATSTQATLARAAPDRSKPSGQPSTFALASSPLRSPADIINSRGFWGGPEIRKLEPGAVMPVVEEVPIAVASAGDLPRGIVQRAEPVRRSESRMQWRVGPQPIAPAATGSIPVAAPTPAPVALASASPAPVRGPLPRPRPRREATVASVAESTASVPWPGSSREDRVPSDLVLAYAAEPQRQGGARPAPAAPMGALRSAPVQPARTTVRRDVAQPSAAEAPQPEPARSNYRLSDNPWLHAVIRAPSLHSSMRVSSFGEPDEPDYLALAPLMHKPANVVVNAFAAAPEFGLSARRFSGQAVAALPLISFRTIRLGMNRNH